MKRVHILLAISSICTMMLTWHLTRDELVPISAVADRPASLPAENPLHQPPEPHAGNRLVRVQPLVDTRPETEEVLGFTVRKDRNCTVEVHHVVDAESGETAQTLVCSPIHPPEPDPYETWDEEVLAGMAYGDAHAAEVLGLRHVLSQDPRREALGLALLYRAAALSGSAEPFRKAIGRRYAPLTLNGEPQVHNAKQLLRFQLIGTALGDGRARPGVISAVLRRADVPYREINAIHRQVNGILEIMATTQTEATGETSIREAIDDA